MKPVQAIAEGVAKLRDLQSALFRQTITGEPLTGSQQRVMARHFVSHLVAVAAVAAEYDRLMFETEFATSEACIAETERVANEMHVALLALAKAVRGGSEPTNKITLLDP